LFPNRSASQHHFLILDASNDLGDCDEGAGGGIGQKRFAVVIGVVVKMLWEDHTMKMVMTFFHQQVAEDVV
jgi:hypothetical protein